MAALELHAVDFNPWYPTSIAYTPLPRPALESFLIQRGLMSKTSQRMDLFHSGFLNKLYLRLNETVFRGSNKVSKISVIHRALLIKYIGNHVSRRRGCT